MTEIIQNFFKDVFGGNVILATILIALLPIIELRGAIPFGMSVAFWGTGALNAWQALLFAFIGSSLVVPILALIFIPILNWLKKTKLFCRLANWFEKRVLKKSDKIVSNLDENFEEDEEKQKLAEKKALRKKFWGVFMFVAIPLPLTGVWTGTCVAVMLGLNFKQTMLAVISGNLCAGVIMTIISLIFGKNTNIVLYVFIALVLVMILVGIVKTIIDKQKAKQVKA